MRVYRVIVWLILVGLIPVYARLPIAGFIPNDGRYPDTVLFWSRLPDAWLWVTTRGLLFDYYSVDSTGTTGAVVFLRYSLPLPVVTPQSPLPVRWTVVRNAKPSYCQPYSELWLRSETGATQLHLWIDRGRLHYEWLGTVPSVLWIVDGADTLTARKTSLEIQTKTGVIYHERLQVVLPVLTRSVPAEFAAVQDSIVTISPEPPVPSWVDPVVRSTFFGGSGNDVITDGAVLPSGNIVVVGSTASPDLPSHRGGYDTTFAPPTDAFLAVLSPTLQLVAFTLIGGSGDDAATAVAVRNGKVWVTGKTSSQDFPTVSALQPDYGGGQTDAFVAVFDTALTTLHYASYIGGTGTDAGKAIASGDGMEIVVLETLSDDLPVSSAAVFDHLQGATDFYCIALDTLYHPLWQSYFGGSGSDVANAAMILDGMLWIAGKTSSADFPVVNALQSSLQGPFDAFVSAIALPDFTLRFSSFLGGRLTDYAVALAPAASGIALSGVTNSDDFPVTTGAVDSNYQGGDDIWVAVLNFRDSLELQAATYVGTQGWEQPVALLALEDSTFFLAGWTSSAQFPTTPDADQPESEGDLDAIVLQLDFSLSRLLYASYFGGIGRDEPTVLRRLPSAAMRFVLAGTTTSPVLPESNRGAYPQAQVVPDAFLTMLQYPLRLLAPDTLVARCPGDSVRFRWRATAHLDSFALWLAASPQDQFPIGVVAARDTAFQWMVPERSTEDTLFTVVATSTDGSVIYDRSEGAIVWYQPPRISQHPEDVTVCPGSDVLFEAEGGGYPPPERAWERSTDGGKSWTPLPYERGYRLFLPTVGQSQQNALFRLRLSNICGVAVSEPAQLRLRPAPQIAVHPVTQSVCPNDSAVFYASAYPYDSVRWQRSDDGGYTWQLLPGATEEFLVIRRADTVSPSALFRAVFFYRECSTATRGASVRKAASPSVITLSTSPTVCPGEEITLFVRAEDALAYRWQWRDRQDRPWRPVYYQASPTLRTTAGGDPGDTLWYRALLIGECDTITTSAIPVFLLPEIPLQTFPSVIEFGTLSECAPQTTQSIQIVNPDTVAHTIVAADASDAFAIQTPLPILLPPGAATTVTIRFVPYQQGVFADTLKLRYAPCQYAIPIAVSGNKLQPFTTDLAVVDYGVHALCRFPLDTVVQLQNRSPTDTLWIHQWTVPPPFVLSTSLPPFLAPQETFITRIVCQPVSDGEFRAALSVAYSIRGCVDTMKIPLLAAARAPSLKVSGLHMDSLRVCRPQLDTTLWIGNRTADTLFLTVDQLPAWMNSDLATPMLLPFDSVALHVRGIPPKGEWSDTLWLTSLPCGERTGVAVTGFRHFDSVAAPEVVSLPAVPVATRRIDTIRIVNRGTTPLWVQQVHFQTATLFRIVRTKPLLPDTLAPGEMLELTIEFFALDTLHTDTLQVRLLGLCPFIVTFPVIGQAQRTAVARWSIVPFEGAPGDTVWLEIRGGLEPILQQLQPQQYVIFARWNATVLTPLDPALRTLPQTGWHTVAIPQPYSDQSADVLVSLPLLVGLGDMEYSPVWIDSVRWLFPDGFSYVLPQEYQPGTFHLRIYKEGAPQLLNPAAGSLSVTITPNPLTDQAMIQLAGVRSPSNFRIQIYSALGQLVLTLVPPLSAFEYDPTTGSWHSTLILSRSQLGHSGTFFLRCSDGVWTVTRLIGVR